MKHIEQQIIERLEAEIKQGENPDIVNLGLKLAIAIVRDVFAQASTERTDK